MRFALACRALALSFVAVCFSGAYSQSNPTEQPSASPASGTSQSPTTLRTNTRLVVVDVVAIDNHGQPVPDLKAGDFILLEDGQPQTISNFVFQAVSPTASSHYDLPANIVSNAPQFRSSSLNVILFDAINGDLQEHAYAKDQLLKFLNTSDLGRPVAIFAMQAQLKLLHDFSTDNKALSSAVASYTPPAVALTTNSMESRISAFSTQGASRTSDRGIENTLSQLNALAKVLSGYPGRKNLIWLSESFPVTLMEGYTQFGSVPGASLALAPTTQQTVQGSGFNRSYAEQIKKVSDALMAAQIAVYPVDSGALGKDSHLSSQHTMEEMAEGTGGRVFKNTNDLALSLKTSVEDGSTYYTLAYYPENKTWDGRFRSIQVKSTRPGVNVRYRMGYYALDPNKLNNESADTVAENFSRLLQLDTPAATQIIFQAQVLTPSEKEKKVKVTFHIDPTTLAFEHKSDGVEYAHLGCTAWAYGKNKEKPTMSSQTVTANLTRSDYQKMMQQRFFPCGLDIDLKPGTYILRMGVLDRASNKIGTASAQVIVP
jgi:VWFA-related protein